MNISMGELTNSELVELSFELYMNRSLQTNFESFELDMKRN